KSDTRGIAFAHAAENEVALDLVTAADAAVAENASVKIDGNCQAGIVFFARNSPPGEPRLENAGGLGLRFQLAISGMLLAGAGSRVIGHQQFKDGFAGL